MEYASRLLVDLCGGEVSDVIQAGDVPKNEITIQYVPSRVLELIGYDIPAPRQKEILEQLGFDVDDKGEKWNVRVPSWRVDVNSPACLVEASYVLHVPMYVRAVHWPRPYYLRGVRK